MPSDAPPPTDPDADARAPVPGDPPADSAPATPPDADPDPVEWRGESHPFLRRFAQYAGAGLFGGLFLVLLVAAALAGVSSLRSGEGEVFLLLVVLFLVGGPLSLLYLAAAADVGGRERLLELVPGARDLRPRRAAVAALLGAAALVLVGAFPPLFYVSLLAVACLSVVGAAANAEGTLDPAAGTLERRYGDRGREGDVRGLRSVRTYRVGSVAVFRLGYEGRDRLSLAKPQLVVVPDDAADAVRAGFEAVRDAEWPDHEVYRASRGERIAVAAFGAVFVGVGAGVAAVVAGTSAEFGFAAYAGGVFCLLGCVFLLYAWVG